MRSTIVLAGFVAALAAGCSTPPQERFFTLASFVLLLWWFATLTAEGDPTPLRYLPVLNPLELTQLAAIALVMVRSRPSRSMTVMLAAVCSSARIPTERIPMAIRTSIRVKPGRGRRGDGGGAGERIGGAFGYG